MAESQIAPDVMTKTIFTCPIGKLIWGYLGLRSGCQPHVVRSREGHHIHGHIERRKARQFGLQAHLACAAKCQSNK
jgi:hypothetical protein